MKYRSRFILRVMCCLHVTVGLLNATPSAPAEYDVKAAFLYNFSKFVEWPADTWKNSDDPFVLCIAGTDPFEGETEAALQQKTIQDKKLVVKQLANPEEPHGCQVIYLSASEEPRLKTLLTASARSGILTVSDIDEFVQRGGMIGMNVERSKVRFDINLTVAEQAGLKISSQLLKLAKKVKGMPPPAK